MNVELSERAARMAEDMVQNGRFASVEDALEYGLMAIEQMETLKPTNCWPTRARRGGRI